MSKKNIGRILAIALVAPVMFSYFCANVFTTSSANTVAAASTKKTTTVFKDVTSKTDYYKEIEWMYKKGGYKGIAKKGGLFKPYYVMTQKEFTTMLKNLYGKRISIKAGSNAKLTQKYATSTLTTVSKQLGYKIKWSGGTPSARVTRSKATHYVKQMIDVAKGHLNP